MLCPLEILEDSPTACLSWDTLGINFSVVSLPPFSSLGPTSYILINDPPHALPMHLSGHFPTLKWPYLSSLWEFS